MATAIYLIDRDEAIEGGDILFKRAFHKQEARFIFSSVDQTRPQELGDKIGEGLFGSGRVVGWAIVGFPNSHVHKVTELKKYVYFGCLVLNSGCSSIDVTKHKYILIAILILSAFCSFFISHGRPTRYQSSILKHKTGKVCLKRGYFGSIPPRNCKIIQLQTIQSDLLSIASVACSSTNHRKRENRKQGEEISSARSNYVVGCSPKRNRPCLHNHCNLASWFSSGVSR